VLHQDLFSSVLDVDDFDELETAVAVEVEEVVEEEVLAVVEPPELQ
jgi:hypothetical protein